MDHVEKQLKRRMNRAIFKAGGVLDGLKEPCHFEREFGRRARAGMEVWLVSAGELRTGW